ncbi:MAG TPA: helix-turn-helix transcriptional regulator [Steroidobacteraceae bacterium]|jgi:transcriptional regulator with XRE-family HTH domain|nr:helix-turn-helix transcriptional regulator [Steroidobacteraceae bacterium]
MTQTPGDATGTESRRRAFAVQTTGDTGSATTTFRCGDADAQRRRELAAFLKAKRAAVEPQKVGLRPGRRRRANGLLREEVAQRAGISPTWYTWLEQGREINPSTEVLEQLADALLLTKSERAHVQTLARPGATSRASMRFSSEVSGELLAWINGLDQTAYVLNGRWDVLAWNEATVRLLGDFGALPAADRNILRMIFLWEHWRNLFVDWESMAESVVAQFRAETARHCGTPELLALTDALARESREFAQLWRARAVDVPRLKVKRLQHPGLGAVELTYAPLRPRGVADDLSVVVYSSRAA